MSEPEGPQLYLITPPQFEPAILFDRVAALLDLPAQTAPISCIRLSAPGAGEDEIRRTADGLREVAHARDVAVLICDHFRLVPEHGLDGVHLRDGTRLYRDARKALGMEAIIGCFCGASRHHAMSAAEMGADYVAMGPLGDPGVLGSGERAQMEDVRWWAEVIETPLVVEGGLDQGMIDALAPMADFLALSEELWQAPDGAEAALQAIRARLADG